jgi:formylglycine-generating enzyme required for sulfatase activity
MEVFLSYSHEDKELRDALVRHLTPLQRQNTITTWHDRKITAGEEWKKAIDSHLESANIILLLISADFMASTYCYDVELQIALQRHENNEARVIPIILRPVDWQHTPFGKLMTLPTDGQAVTLWSNQDAAFANVAKGLRQAIEELQPALSIAGSALLMPSISTPQIHSPPPSAMSSVAYALSTFSSFIRRQFLRILGFDSSGAVGAVFLAQFFKPPQPLAPVNSPTTAKIPISFTGVSLGRSGQILDRPLGQASVFKEDLGKEVLMTMVKIPEGKFTMGSSADEKGRSWNESPQHLVTVPEFYLGQTLVTQAQWQAIMGNNPSHFTGNSNLPVELVNWIDAMEFCQKLSQKTGRAYRLPSEAEWEYACRAQTQTPFAYGETIVPAVANCDGTFPYGNAAQGEYRQKTMIVANFPPNAFGLYDMHGNLREWCLDEWMEDYNNAPTDGSVRENVISLANGNYYRLLRGGSWKNGARDCRSAVRSYCAASSRSYDVGFRVVVAPARNFSCQNS